MSDQDQAEKRSRLIDQVEVEVIRDPRDPFVEKESPVTYEASPLVALAELVERLEEMEAQSNPEEAELSNSTNHGHAISEMQRHLEQFQRESQVLKRLLMKLH